MKELKFRAYIHPYCGGDTPQELYNSMDYSDNYGGDLEDFFGSYSPTFFRIMQYTGLKDKYGKEVYEGDIINIMGENVTIKRSEEDLTFIFWYSKHQEWHRLNLLKGLGEFEIVGNIYETQHD